LILISPEVVISKSEITIPISSATTCATTLRQPASPISMYSTGFGASFLPPKDSGSSTMVLKPLTVVDNFVLFIFVNNTLSVVSRKNLNT